MSQDLHGTPDFERQVRMLLEQSVQRVGGRARSRLNLARHAALAEAARPRRWLLPWRLALWGGGHLSWMPAAGAIAAAGLVALVLWQRPPQMSYPAVEASHTTVEDLDLLADHDGMELMQGGDGQFYEWAMAQARAGAPSRAPGPGATMQDRGPGGTRGRQNRDPGADQNSG